MRGNIPYVFSPHSPLDFITLWTLPLRIIGFSRLFVLFLCSHKVIVGAFSVLGDRFNRWLEVFKNPLGADSWREGVNALSLTIANDTKLFFVLVQKL